jgi:16S rRNA (guanine527-N7)-methyltransferase
MAELLGFDPKALIDQYLDRKKLDLYYELLMEQNRLVNLVSRETDRGAFDRMVAESLLPLDRIERPVKTYLDIGSGGGLPSIPILLSGSVAGDSFLVERTGKKAKALGEIIQGLNLPARIVSSNFEEISDLPRLHLISLRYVKLSRRLLERIMKNIKRDGSFVYYSTPDFKQTSFAAQTWSFGSGEDQVIKSFTVFTK